ncbi:MAG: hypothetical protein H5U01_08110 [Clostridia bacterium]|nr:hypothetical protein [Clostridia bacterium]
MAYLGARLASGGEHLPPVPQETYTRLVRLLLRHVLQEEPGRSPAAKTRRASGSVVRPSKGRNRA